MHWRPALPVLVITLALLAPVAAAQDAPEWRAPELHFVHGVAGVGDRVFLAASNQGVLELAPGEDPRAITGPRSAVAIASAGSSVFVADRQRAIHRLDDGRWTRGPTAPENGFADDIVELATGGGRVYALARHARLHVWTGRGRRLRTVRLGDGGDARHLAVAGRRVFITGDERRFVEVRGGRARRPAFADAVFNALDHDYQELGALWVSPTTGHLWIGTSADRVLEVDLDSNRVTVHDVDRFGLFRAITSVVIDGREVIVIAAQSELATLTDGRVENLPGEASFPSGLHVHPGTDTLVVSAQDGVHFWSLRERRELPRTDAEATRAPSESSAASSDARPRRGDDGGDDDAGDEGGGVRFEDVHLEGQCGVFGAMALIGQAQSRAGACVPRGASVDVTMTVRNNRATAVQAESGRPAACVRRRLRNLPVPGASRCDVRFTIRH